MITQNGHTYTEKRYVWSQEDTRPPLRHWEKRPRCLASRRTRREGLAEFTYKKVMVPSRHWRTPKLLRVAWDIYWKDEWMVQVSTLKEVKAYINEKLDT